jgi:hypothetical protein
MTTDMEEQKNKQRSSKLPWSDSELRTSVDAYLYMLQLEVAAVPFSVTEQEKLLSSGPLSDRNDASVRYRLRNISYVMRERGEMTLTAYSSAPQVGKNVKARIHRLLDERENTLRSIRQAGSNGDAEAVELDEVLAGLNQLREMISSLVPETRAVAGIGHNNPPGENPIGASDFSEAIQAIYRIENAVSSGGPDLGVVESGSNVLARLGMKLALWAGQRVTDFVKTGAVAAGTGAGLSLSGLGGKIIETLHQVFANLF